MRRATLLAVLLALVVVVPAQAHPVSVKRAERAIRHWWLDRQPPNILWCVPKHYGTICALRQSLDVSGPFASDVHGYDIKIVWVSRTHGKVAVASLYDYLNAVINY